MDMFTQGYRMGVQRRKAGKYYPLPSKVHTSKMYKRGFQRGFAGQKAYSPKTGQELKRNPGMSWLLLGGAASAAWWLLKKKAQAPAVAPPVQQVVDREDPPTGPPTSREANVDGYGRYVVASRHGI